MSLRTQAFSSQGAYVSLAGDERVWDCKTGQVLPLECFTSSESQAQAAELRDCEQSLCARHSKARAWLGQHGAQPSLGSSPACAGAVQSSAPARAHLTEPSLALVNVLLHEEFRMTANLSHCGRITRFLTLLKNNAALGFIYQGVDCC